MFPSHDPRVHRDTQKSIKILRRHQTYSKFKYQTESSIDILEIQRTYSKFNKDTQESGKFLCSIMLTSVCDYVAPYEAL